MWSSSFCPGCHLSSGSSGCIALVQEGAELGLRGSIWMVSLHKVISSILNIYTFLHVCYS